MLSGKISRNTSVKYNIVICKYKYCVKEPYTGTFYSVADPDPGSGAFLPPGSGMLLYRIRDPVLFYPPDPGSGSGMEQWSDSGSGIKRPGSATLTFYNT
jgi:hypothetical protein